MTFVRSLLFAVVFYAATVVAVLFAFPVSLLGPRWLRPYTVGWARIHRWCARTFLGITTRIEGAVPEGPHLVISKHQSMYETLELIVILDEPAVVLKRELAEIPLWGKVARMYGAIPVDREGSTHALRSMMRAAKAAVAEQRAILLFPEGTRVAPGEQPPLKAGFAGLYRALDLPVSPVALDSGRLCPRGRFIKHPGVITFRFGEPIPPGLDRRRAETLAHAAINALE